MSKKSKKNKKNQFNTVFDSLFGMEAEENTTIHEKPEKKEKKQKHGKEQSIPVAASNTTVTGSKEGNEVSSLKKKKDEMLKELVKLDEKIHENVQKKINSNEKKSMKELKEEYPVNRDIIWKDKDSDDVIEGCHGKGDNSYNQIPYLELKSYARKFTESMNSKVGLKLMFMHHSGIPSEAGSIRDRALSTAYHYMLAVLDHNNELEQQYGSDLVKFIGKDAYDLYFLPYVAQIRAVKKIA